MGAELTLRVTEVAGSGDVLTNKSRVHIYLACTTNSGTWSHDGTTEGYIRMDGAQIANLKGAWVDMNTTTRIHEADYEVTHNVDGTKSIVVEAGFNLNTTYTGWVYATVPLTLSTIPRKSTMTVPGITLGAQNNLQVSAASTEFEHTILFNLGGVSGEARKGVSGGTVAWTPDIELCRQMPSAMSKDGTLTLITYHGGSEIGRNSYPFTAYVPNTVVPVIQSIDCWPINDNSTLHNWGVYVKGKTKVQFSVGADGAYGSSVNSCTFSFAGQSLNSFSGTTGVLFSAGDFTPSANVTDTRGRPSGVSYGSAITVYDYAVPTIGSSYAHRSNASGTADESGTHVAVMCSAGCASVGGRNKVTLRVRTRPTTGSWSGYTTLTNGVQMVLSGYSEKTSYEVELSATDELGETKTVLYTVPTEAVTFMLGDGGDKAAFGKYVEHNGLDMGWDIHMNGNRVTGLPTPSSDTDAVPWGDVNGKFAPSGYGLGGDSPYVADCNAIGANGWYFGGASTANSPCGYFTLLHLYRTASEANQLAFDVSGNNMYFRFKVDGGWSAWAKVNPYNFAPSGYGLGVDEPTLVTDLNTATRSGWYKFGNYAANAPDTGSYWMYVSAFSPAYIYQEVYNDTYKVILSRWLRGDGWSPWEWVDPPMSTGVEYRTTERWQGVPVYARAVNVGYVSAGSQSFAHNCAMSQPISADVYNNDCELLTGYSGITNLTVSTTHVHFNGTNAFGNITFHLKYTK